MTHVLSILVNLAYTSGGQDPLFDGHWNNGVARETINVQLQHTFIVSAINIVLGKTQFFIDYM